MPKNQTSQRIKAVIIAILLAMSLVGAGVYGYLSGTPSPSPTSSPSSSGSNDYNGMKNRVNALTQQVKSNPNDIQLQQALGDAYYDLGTFARTAAPNEAKVDFIQATKCYQTVLSTKQDINVLTDMATAAFYSGQNDLAEKSYQEALNEQPDFQQALFDYGIFLFQIKQDYATAIRMWQTALNKDPNGPNADHLKQLIIKANDAKTSR